MSEEESREQIEEIINNEEPACVTKEAVIETITEEIKEEKVKPKPKAKPKSKSRAKPKQIKITKEPVEPIIEEAPIEVIEKPKK